jgi:uncharacterized protein (TIGR03000 family)
MRFSRRSTFAIATLSALSLTFGSARSASAFGFGSHGSSGGSWGSHGSSGGSWFGSHGSSGGSWGSSGGSSGGYTYGSSGGSYGSSGGSYGSGGGYYGSSGGYYDSSGGSYGYGSGGGSYGYGSGGGSYGYVASNLGASSVAPETRVAYLNLKVPADAKVYLQDQQMTLGGAQRRFVTPELQEGKQHTYTVRVEVVRDGRTISKTTMAAVKPGQEVEIAVSFTDQNPNELVASVTSHSSR